MADQTRADLAHADDARIVAEMAIGNAQGLAALYDRHAAAMLRLALHVLGDPRDCEDLVHDVFLEAWRSAARYDPTRGDVRGWLLVMIRSRAVDRLRALAVMRRHLRHADRGERASALSHAEIDGVRGVTRARALDAISALPEPQRRIVQMSCLEGLSCREIALRCELPLGTVKSRLTRALAALREQLGGERVA